MLFILFLTTNVAAQVTLVRDVNPFAQAAPPELTGEWNAFLRLMMGPWRGLWKSMAQVKP
jgi:hypothetical protein